MTAWTMVVEVGLADSPLAASPTWTDVSAAVMAGDGVSLTRGATSGEQAGAGQFSCTINRDRLAELSLPDLTGPTLLRRPIRFRARKGTTTYDLGRFHVTDVVALRDGVRRVRVSGTDAFALWDEAKRGGDVAWHLEQCGARRRWRLDDEGPVARDAIAAAELVELEVGDTFGGADTYGTVTWGGSGLVPCPSAAGVVGFEAADILGSGGFTGLSGELPTGVPFGISFWMRLPEAPITPSLRAGLPYMVVPAVQLRPVVGGPGRWFGFWVAAGDPAVYPATGYITASAANQHGPLMLDVGLGWVHVDYRVTASGTSCTLTRPDGAQWDGAQVSPPLGATVDGDHMRFAGGYSGLLLGGLDWPSPSGQPFPAGACEVSDVIVWDGVAADSGMVRAAIGWPGEAPATRLSRLANEAGVTAPTMTAVALELTSQPDTRTSLMEGWREVEGAVLGLLHVQADGTAAVLTRAELEDDAVSSATLHASLIMADADGVTTNTSMIVNSSTVTAAHVADTSERRANAASVAAWGERADDRSMAVEDRDWLALSAGWLANRAAYPTEAFGLPALVLDPDQIATRRPAGDPLTVLPFTVDVGDVLTLPDTLDAPIDVQVWGVSWQVTPSSGWRCSLTVRPYRAASRFQLDRDSLDGPAIIGW